MGQTAKALAKLCGLHPSSIKYYISGKRRPKLKNAQTIEYFTNGKVTVKDQFLYYKKMQKRKVE